MRTASGLFAGNGGRLSVTDVSWEQNGRQICVDDWFTIEKIGPDTYAISEYRHWEQAHSYLAPGREKAALIDTGSGVGDLGAGYKGADRSAGEGVDNARTLGSHRRT